MEAIAPRALRFVEGEVGVAQYFVDSFAMMRNKGYADAAAYDDRVAVDRIRGADRFDQAGRQRFRALSAPAFARLHEHRELIAAETGGEIDVADRGLDPAGDGLEQHVAALVAERIVGALEFV